MRRNEFRLQHPHHEYHIEYHVDHHRLDTDAHRGSGVLARVKATRQDFDEDESRQPETVGHQAVGRHHRIAVLERAIFEQRGEYGLRQQEQADGRRQRNDQGELNGPGQRLVEAVIAFTVPVSRI